MTRFLCRYASHGDHLCRSRAAAACGTTSTPSWIYKSRVMSRVVGITRPHAWLRCGKVSPADGPYWLAADFGMATRKRRGRPAGDRGGAGAPQSVDQMERPIARSWSSTFRGPPLPWLICIAMGGEYHEVGFVCTSDVPRRENSRRRMDRISHNLLILLVGAAGFEPATR